MTTKAKKLDHVEVNTMKSFSDLAKKQARKVPGYVTETTGKTRIFLKEKKATVQRVAYATLCFLFLVGLMQNIEPSSINFLFWSFEASKLTMFLIMIAIGAVGGIAVYKKLIEMDARD